MSTFLPLSKNKLHMKTRVLHIVPQFTTGGAEKMTLYYGKMLDQSRFEVTVACAVDTGELESAFHEAKVPIHVSSRSKLGGRMKAYKDLISFAKQYQPDIIHTHLFGGDLIGGMLKLFVLRKSAWVVTLHNVEPKTSIIRKIIWMILLRFPDRVITVSPGVAAYAAKRFLVSKQKRVLVMNGIPLDPWLIVPPAFTHAASEREVQIATIGRLEEQKGHTYLLEALATITELPWHLHIYGNGSLYRSLTAQMHRLRLTDRVSFHGVTQDIPRALADVDIVVQPSLWEGLSLVVMEAMAAGKYVITTPAGGAGIITPGANGDIVRTKDSKVLAEALTQGITNTESAQYIAKEAREYAKANFAMEHNVAAIEDIYTELI